MSSAGTARWTIASLDNARPSRDRRRGSSVGSGGAVSVSLHLVLIRWDLGAAQYEACRRVLKGQGDLVGEPVPAQRIDRERRRTLRRGR